ncbi:osmotically inducible protein OsmC [Sphingobacteriaceae bacterium]|nr:osmotically inducible protein OsmC [Sphingobacteriaceae bacterium]
MESIKASIGTEHYKIEIVSPTGNLVIADEPVESGGQNKGFSPKELLASSLAACTLATLKMYADRKKWPLEKVDINVDLIEDEGKVIFKRKITLHGKFELEQLDKFLKIANACPVHKILSGSSSVETEIQ